MKCKITGKHHQNQKVHFKIYHLIGLQLINVAKKKKTLIELNYSLRAFVFFKMLNNFD